METSLLTIRNALKTNKSKGASKPDNPVDPGIGFFFENVMGRRKGVFKGSGQKKKRQKLALGIQSSNVRGWAVGVKNHRNETQVVFKLPLLTSLRWLDDL